MASRAEIVRNLRAHAAIEDAAHARELSEAADMLETPTTELIVYAAGRGVKIGGDRCEIVYLHDAEGTMLGAIVPRMVGPEGETATWRLLHVESREMVPHTLTSSREWRTEMAHDLKYGKVTAEHGDREHGGPGVGVPLNESDEPVFILRAQDKTSLAVLRYYLLQSVKAGAPRDHTDKVLDVYDAFEEWQGNLDHVVKVPD